MAKKPPKLGADELARWRDELAQLAADDLIDTSAPTPRRQPPGAADSTMTLHVEVPQPLAPQRPLAVGAYYDIDRATAMRMKKGKYVTQQIIDLHGHSQTEAFAMLREQIPRAYEAGHRHLLVITGKGRNVQGVLRGKLIGWVNDEAIRPFVLAIDTAQPQDGGSGAFYLLLKRRRSHDATQ